VTGGHLDGLVQILDVDPREAPDLFLGLDVGPSDRVVPVRGRSCSEAAEDLALSLCGRVHDPE
jgi:hypothetical protein